MCVTVTCLVHATGNQATVRSCVTTAVVPKLIHGCGLRGSGSHPPCQGGACNHLPGSSKSITTRRSLPDTRGKVLRGSFDRFHDRAAAGVPSAFATDTALVLAHADIAEKASEIAAAQTLLAELGLATGTSVALDAVHCENHFQVAAQAGHALIVQVKRSQPTRHGGGHRPTRGGAIVCARRCPPVVRRIW